MKYTVVWEWCDYDAGGMESVEVDATSPEDAIEALLDRFNEYSSPLVFEGVANDMSDHVKSLILEKRKREEAEREAKAKAKAEARKRAQYEKLRAEFEGKQ